MRVMPWLMDDPKSTKALMATSKNATMNCALRIVNGGDPVRWPVLWDAFVRTRYVIGEEVCGVRKRLRAMIKHPMSRLCRGCGSKTYRVVMGSRVCEQCTRTQVRKFHMVPFEHVVRCFPCAALWNLLTHRGRRARMCFMHDVCVATGLRHFEILIRLYDETPQR